MFHYQKAALQRTRTPSPCERASHTSLAEIIDYGIANGGPPSYSTDHQQEHRESCLAFPHKYTEWKKLSLPEALSIIQHAGRLPSHDNFLCILLKCKKEKSLEHLKRLYQLILIDNTAFEALGNYFVSAFVQCDSIPSAHCAFDRLSYRNEYSWTSLIQAHIDNGNVSLAFDLYRRMQVENVPANNFTFVALLRASVRLKSIEKGREIHAEVAKEGYEVNEFVGSILVDLYAKCGSIDDAYGVFDELKVRDTVLWTAVIAGYTEQGLAEEALKCFQQMQIDGVPQDAGTYVCVLKACSTLEAVSRGQEIHCEATAKGLNSNPFVENTLLYFYAKCGHIDEVQTVFDKLSFPDVVSWNALVTGYSENKLSDRVLLGLAQMQVEGRSPNAVTLSCSLKACGSLRAVDRGHDLHSAVWKMGYEKELVVGNTLVDMYSKFGFRTEALSVFDSLPYRDIVSWNTIFAACAEHGLADEGMFFYEKLKSEGMSPSSITFTCALKACGSEGFIEGGLVLHNELMFLGLEDDIQIGNTLVDMYSKCGWLTESQRAFDEQPSHSVVSWNVLIAGYAERRLCEKVWSCLRCMQESEVPPDALTYVFVLKSCEVSDAFERCQEIHAEVVKDGLETESQVASCLVVLYSKCGALPDAWEIFETLSDRDVVTWTALVNGLAEYGTGKEALKMFQKMYTEGILPNGFTYVSGLKACSKLNDMQSGQAMHSELLKKGYDKDPFVCSALVDMYCNIGRAKEAHGLLAQQNDRDLVSWTALISGYAEDGLWEEAFSCFEQVQLEGLSPDLVLWNAIFFACIENGEYEKALKFFTQMQEQGVLPDSAVFVSILGACSNPAALELGRKLHVMLCRGGQEVQETILMNALIDMYGRGGSMIEAQVIFDAMPIWDLASWNSLCSGYAHQGESDRVFHLYRRMRQHGIHPDAISFLNLLIACSHAGLVYEGFNYLEFMIEAYGIKPKIKHHTCLIDLLARAGQLDGALVAIEQMPLEPDFVVWSAMLSACRKWGNTNLGRQSFKRALNLEEKNVGAFITMYNIYSEAQMWPQAMEIQEFCMESLYNLNENPVSNCFWHGQ